MYRFARRPAWLVSHVLVLALIVALASLGFWQLRRLDERQARNELVVARIDDPPVPVAGLLGSDADEVQFRRVEVAGTFVGGSSVLVDNRTLDGRPGAWILDPLVLASGESIIVNRGFVPFVDGIEVDVPAVPVGAQRFEGVVEPDADRFCAAVDRDEPGVVSRYACIDLDQVAADLGLDEVPAFEVRAQVTLPPVDADPGFPTPVPLPELDDGPHLGYAVQWFIFMTIAIVGYPLVLRRVARNGDLPDAIDREEATLPAEGEVTSGRVG